MNYAFTKNIIPQWMCNSTSACETVYVFYWLLRRWPCMRVISEFFLFSLLQNTRKFMENTFFKHNDDVYNIFL